MRIVVCHNHYRQAGGEDQVFADECKLLESNGHELTKFVRHNDDVDEGAKIRLAADTIWNRKACKELAEEIRRTKSEIAHFHNTLPLISPAAFRAARSAGAAVVLTLHNYRLMCPKGTFFRDGNLCESCLGRVALPAIKHKCYRESYAGSAVLAAMLSTHRMIGTYRKHIDAYVSLCQFAKDKHVQAGFPAERIAIKPNFMPVDPGPGAGEGDFLVCVGRLSPEKGLGILLEAWVKHRPQVRLRIVGRGPMEGAVRRAVAENPLISLDVDASYDDVMSYLGAARAFVLPSVNFEGFPKTIVESFSRSTPVIASRLGAMAELVDEGETGFHFSPGDSADLARVVKNVCAERSTLGLMRQDVRTKFEQNYTAVTNHQRMMEIYQEALQRRHGVVADVSKSREEQSPATSLRVSVEGLK